MSDPVFDEEQKHLSDVYAKLEGIERETHAKLAANLDTASKEMKDMQDEMSFDFASNDVQVETAAEYETMNAVIEAYNRADDANARRWRAASQLLRQPYFAKVALRFKPGAAPREIYLGSAGMTDENSRHFIIDWRSPVAETYYNQENGKTSYTVDGRTITADLVLRRQFDIDRDKLNAYFDTTVAIEDPLLLKSLSREHSEKLSAITATIQKEQNEVVRHEDVPALLVNGIAGSGKTSVLLQRIAYLFYRRRDDLRPDQVYLFTPNPVFGKYIDNVLPDMGESNPVIVTWDSFVKQLGLLDHGLGTDTKAETLRALERGVENLKLEAADFKDVEYDGFRLLKAAQVQRAAEKFPHVPAGPRLAALVCDELAERIKSKLKSLENNEKIHELMFDLDADEKVRLFGQPQLPADDDELLECARTYLTDRFAGVFEELENTPWLRIDRIGCRILGKGNLTAVEWLYAKILLTGASQRDARYVMVDEVQDYSEAQLMVMARYFPRAHFLLLGDQHQAIHEGTAEFPQIREVFARTHGQVDECRLLTSYRSTPEITALFTGLLDRDERVKTSSVQREGVAPVLQEHQSADEYLDALRKVIDDCANQGGLTAIIAADWGRVKWLEKQVGNAATVMRSNMSLPEKGVILIDLPLAKGLEFDHVIIPDAQEAVYPDTRISRRRLYTALSRATQSVAVLAQGPLTPLLRK